MEIHPEAPARALQRRAGRHARPRVTRTRSIARCGRGIAAGLAALALLLPGVSRAADAFSASYPHLYYDDTGWLDGDLAVIRRFHVLSTAFWNCEGSTAARLDSLAVMNPDLVRIAYLNAAGRSLPDVADPNHIVNRLRAGIQDAWLVRNELGQVVYWDPTIPNMPLLNLSTRCPRVGGRTYGEFIADFAAQQILANGRFDGIMFDNIWGNAQWVNNAIPGSLDLDNNQVADHPDSVDAWWVQGNALMLARFRAQVGPNVTAIGNGNHRHFSPLNGRYFEGFPYREGWAGTLTEASDWQTYGRPPILLAGVTRSTEQDFRLMRFGLTTALIGGFFSFHYAEEHSWPNPIFYDEYGANLGQPVGEPIELGLDVIGGAEFETGLPPNFPGSCGTGIPQWTTAPNLVIDGVGSLRGLPGSGPSIWRIFMCSNPSALPLTAGQTYTLTFRYRVVAEPPGTGFFFVGARSDQNQSASDRSMMHFDPPLGTLDEARAEVTLGPYSNYYFYFGMNQGGEIVIDSIQVVRGRGGAFRRNFEHGLALVNPSSTPITLDLEPGFRRIAGHVNPFYNTGQPVTQITLAPEDGIVLLREPAGIPPEDPPPSPPAPEVVVAYPNPVPLTQGDPAVVSGVPAGGSVTIVNATGRHIRRIAGDQGRCAWDLRSARGTRAAPGVYLVIVRDAAEKQVGSTRLTLAR